MSYERLEIIDLLADAMSALRQTTPDIGRALWRVADAGVRLGRLADQTPRTTPLAGWDHATCRGARLVDELKKDDTTTTKGEEDHA